MQLTTRYERAYHDKKQEENREISAKYFFPYECLRTSEACTPKYNYFSPPSGVSAERCPLQGPLLARHRTSHDSRGWEGYHRIKWSFCSTSAWPQVVPVGNKRFRGFYRLEIIRFHRNTLGSHWRTNTLRFLTKTVKLISRKAPTRYVCVAAIM